MFSTAPSAVGADPDEDKGAVGTAAAVAATLVDGSTATKDGGTEDNAGDTAVTTMAEFDTPIKAAGCATIGDAFDDGNGDNEEEEEVEEEDNVEAIDAIADDNSEVGSTTVSADPLCNHRCRRALSASNSS